MTSIFSKIKCPHNKTIEEDCDECEVVYLKASIDYWRNRVLKDEERLEQLRKKLKS